jgi:hypothetical protein
MYSKPVSVQSDDKQASEDWSTSSSRNVVYIKHIPDNWKFLTKEDNLTKLLCGSFLL